jgi:mycoredoxin
MSDPIVMYTSSFCAHSWRVQRFLKSHGVAVELISIDRNERARQELMAINGGYASVPTLIFSDGTQLTEPSFGQLRSKLEIEKPSVKARIKRILGK